MLFFRSGPHLSMCGKIRWRVLPAFRFGRTWLVGNVRARQSTCHLEERGYAPHGSLDECCSPVPYPCLAIPCASVVKHQGPTTGPMLTPGVKFIREDCFRRTRTGAHRRDETPQNHATVLASTVSHEESVYSVAIDA